MAEKRRAMRRRPPPRRHQFEIHRLDTGQQSRQRAQLAVTLATSGIIAVAGGSFYAISPQCRWRAARALLRCTAAGSVILPSVIPAYAHTAGPPLIYSDMRGEIREHAETACYAIDSGIRRQASYGKRAAARAGGIQRMAGAAISSRRKKREEWWEAGAARRAGEALRRGQRRCVIQRVALRAGALLFARICAHAVAGRRQ